MISLHNSSALGQPTFALPRDIIATVLDVTVTAWSQVLANREIGIDNSEPEIAGCLGRAMLAEKNRRPALKRQFRIEEEVGTRSSPDVPKPEGRIDIKIVYSFDEDEYFGMECKRVSGKDKVLARKYVSDGVMRFVAGKYSPGHDWAAMLGFVIYGNVTDCAKLISDRLVKSRQTTGMEDDWTPAKEFGAYDDLYRTHHRQHGRKFPMSILHLFLIIN